MKIRNNLSMWLCRHSVYANTISFNLARYGQMCNFVVDKYISSHIKRKK